MFFRDSPDRPVRNRRAPIVEKAGRIAPASALIPDAADAEPAEAAVDAAAAAVVDVAVPADPEAVARWVIVRREQAARQALLDPLEIDRLAHLARTVARLRKAESPYTIHRRKRDQGPRILNSFSDEFADI